METIRFAFKFQYLLVPGSPPQSAENGRAPPEEYLKKRSPVFAAPRTSTVPELSPESLRDVRSAAVPFQIEGNVTSLKRKASFSTSEQAGHVSKKPKLTTMQPTRHFCPAEPSPADRVMSASGDDSARARDMSLSARIQRYLDS